MFKKIMPFVICVFSSAVLVILSGLPIFWGGKIAITTGIILTNIKLWLYLQHSKTDIYEGDHDPKNDVSQPSPDEALVPKDEIDSLTRELDRICAAIDCLKEKIEHTYSKTEQKMYSQTKALNNIIRQLRRDANHDSMTGLANRRHFGQHSQQLFQQARQNGADLACIMIDIDHFKQVNDHFSHMTGDCVIVMIGELLKASVRQGDLCARFGGDEFIMLLQDCSSTEALRIAKRIRQTFFQKTTNIIKQSLEEDTSCGMSDIPNVHELAGLTGLSIGIATLNKNQPDNLEQLIRMADKALYRAKQVGETVA